MNASVHRERALLVTSRFCENAALDFLASTMRLRGDIKNSSRRLETRVPSERFEQESEKAHRTLLRRGNKKCVQYRLMRKNI